MATPLDAQLETLLEQAQTVLKNNDRQGQFTVPAADLYPHQWLWDSCFIACGLRHLDVLRAQAEVLSLLKGQWSNGMLPNMIFDASDQHRHDQNLWRSWINPFAPDHLATSGITQPPLLAEAIVRIGQKLPRTERRTWYQKTYPNLLKYHEWLYADRDPHSRGLTVQLHPWETGMDNSPTWIGELHAHHSWWIKAAEALHLQPVINLFRRDVKQVPQEQRLDAIDALALYSLQQRLRRKAYQTNAILKHPALAIEDVGFNAILIRANQHLLVIAKDIGQILPDSLVANMHNTETALEELWSDERKLYFSRNFVSHELINAPTIASLLPLYAGSVSKERAEQLVHNLCAKQGFGARFPVPSVPVKSDWFKEFAYWQGPTWINMNWLLIDGLRRYGYDDLADNLRDSCLQLVSKSGFYEYFSALNGQPAGAANFSWTAALIIDLIKS